MERCIALAKMGQGHVAPNPMVGAVLVHGDTIIGEGYHEKYGEPHAEVNCIASVKPAMLPLIKESVLYVSLEPCAHFGKTPPCTNLIIKNNIPKVVIGCRDIFAEVNGKGIQQLREAGVEVITGIRESESIRLNKRFFTQHTFDRPYIILKWAQTANGVIGIPEKRLAISNRYTNTLVHQWRSEEAAILVGCDTAISDDPLLTNRYGSGKQPLRIVLCRKNPDHAFSMFKEPGRTVIFNLQTNKTDDQVTFIKLEKENYLKNVLTSLHKIGIQSVMVEGGAMTLQSFFDEDAWDECRIITNREMIATGGTRAPSLPTMELQHEDEIFNDTIQYYGNTHNHFVVRH